MNATPNGDLPHELLADAFRRSRDVHDALGDLMQVLHLDQTAAFAGLCNSALVTGRSIWAVAADYLVTGELSAG